MAVTTTTIAGTDSLSGSRITINDNFKTLEDALNSVLSAFDITTGTFNNASYGSNNDILTNGIVINGSGLVDALTINSNDLNMVNGSIKLAPNKHLVIGAQLQLNQEDIVETNGTIPSWDLRSAGLLSDQIAGIVLPNLTAAGYGAITVDIPNNVTPPLGTIAFTDDGTAGTDVPLRIFWDDTAAGGAFGPGWYAIQATFIP